MDIAILLYVIIYIIVQIDLKADGISSDADLVWPFDDSDEESSSTLQQNEPVGQDQPPAIFILSVFLLLWKSLFKLPGSATVALLKFLKYFLEYCGNLFACPRLKQFALSIPSTLQTLEKLADVHRQTYKKFVMCQKCYCIYDWKETLRIPLVCVRLSTAVTLHILGTLTLDFEALNFKQFCYNSLITSLTLFVQRQGILEQLNAWKSRTVEQGVLNDIYDGRIGKISKQ